MFLDEAILKYSSDAAYYEHSLKRRSDEHDDPFGLSMEGMIPAESTFKKKNHVLLSIARPLDDVEVSNKPLLSLMIFSDMINPDEAQIIALRAAVALQQPADRLQ